MEKQEWILNMMNRPLGRMILSSVKKDHLFSLQSLRMELTWIKEYGEQIIMLLEQRELHLVQVDATRGNKGLSLIQLQWGGSYCQASVTKPKRKRDETLFNDKVLLVQAQASGQALSEEEIAFLADPGLPDIQTSQTVNHLH
ncbi:hypothetical protein Tco_0362739 [Tanacetum coccineum]